MRDFLPGALVSVCTANLIDLEPLHLSDERVSVSFTLLGPLLDQLSHRPQVATEHLCFRLPINHRPIESKRKPRSVTQASRKRHGPICGSKIGFCREVFLAPRGSTVHHRASKPVRVLSSGCPRVVLLVSCFPKQSAACLVVSRPLLVRVFCCLVT